MRKQLLTLVALSFALTGCFDLPSPQDTQPTQQSKCAAIRAKMMQSQQTGPSNNTPAAVSDSQNINYRKIYHEECE